MIFSLGHHFESMYPHHHHVMPKIRRKKKTSVSSDDGQLSDEESGRKKSGHGKRRSSKKDIDHLPTIEDETKAQVKIKFTVQWVHTSFDNLNHVQL